MSLLFSLDDYPDVTDTEIIYQVKDRWEKYQKKCIQKGDKRKYRVDFLVNDGFRDSFFYNGVTVKFCVTTGNLVYIERDDSDEMMFLYVATYDLLNYCKSNNVGDIINGKCF